MLVFEDLSDLLKAQKQAAWREVARRVAHEIKNPLTPIALSAERMRRKFLGSTMPVLLEQKDKGLWSGLTDNYIRVFVDNEEDLTNRIVPVKMVEVWGEGMRGELIENNTNTTNAK